MRPAPRHQGETARRPGPLIPDPLSRARYALVLALLLAALAALLLPQLSAPPLERAEVYFRDAARGMVESGDWWLPRYEGQPFFD